MSQSNNIVSVSTLMQSSGVRFGTSGVRGLVTAMSDELIFAYALAFFSAIKTNAGSSVAIAVDLRPSSPHIASVCYAAAQSLGLKPEFCGAIPTPALAYYTEQNKMPGIMVTGSHIPFDRNGIKFYSKAGEITKAHERAITNTTVQLPEAGLTKILPAPNGNARNAYIKRYTDFFDKNVLSGLKLGFYQHSSVARDVLTEILSSLGADVIAIERTEEFVPIDTEAVSQEDTEKARAWAKEYNFDAILSTDGDADRPLIGDENGEWLRGDIVGLLTAQFLKATAIATPVSCNTAIEKSNLFKQVIRTRIGSPYVIEAMNNLLDDNQAVVGFEANGGFLLASNVFKGDTSLKPLCTRDAILPMLAVIALSKQNGCKLSGVSANLPERFTASDRIKSVETEKSKRILGALANSNADIESLLASLLTKVVAIDLTDGLRITSDKDEVIHYRPSGNAPELRCYAEASTQDRARLLVTEALKLIQTIER